MWRRNNKFICPCGRRPTCQDVSGFSACCSRSWGLGRACFSVNPREEYPLERVFELLEHVAVEALGMRSLLAIVVILMSFPV